MVARVYYKNLVAIRNSANNIEVLNDALKRIVSECPIVEDIVTEEEYNVLSNFTSNPENTILAVDTCPVKPDGVSIPHHDHMHDLEKIPGNDHVVTTSEDVLPDDTPTKGGKCTAVFFRISDRQMLQIIFSKIIKEASDANDINAKIIRKYLSDQDFYCTRITP